VIAALVLALPAAAFAGRAAADGCGFTLADAERERAAAIAKELRDAEEQSAKAPSDGAVLLRDALEHASADAVLVAKSDAARQAQRYARLALVRSLLATGDREAATGLLDEMLAIAGEEPLPAKLFGPSVVELHAERAAALGKREMSEVVVECDVDCVALASDTLLGCAGASRPLHVRLPVGPWRVTVVASADASHKTASDLELVAGTSRPAIAIASAGCRAGPASSACRSAPPR
jgi:hypothetical protein